MSDLQLLRDLIENQNRIISVQAELIEMFKKESEIYNLKEENNILKYPEKTMDNKVNLGFVYIAKQINEENIYKIGKTLDIDSRLKTFKIGNVFIEIIATSRACNYSLLERILHKRLSFFRISGEWFDFDNDILDELINEYGFVRHLAPCL